MSDAALFGDTDDAALFGDPPKKAAPKYPGPKAADDQALGLETAPMRAGATNFERLTSGYPGGVSQESVGPEAQRLRDIDLKQRAEEFGANVGGQVVGAAILPGVGEGLSRLTTPAIKPVAKIGINALSAFAKAGAQETAPDLIKKAISASAKHLAEKAFGETGAELAGRAAAATGQAAAKAGGAVARGAGALAATATPPAAGTALSNAVERLRANAAISPSAMDFTRRMEAAKNTPLNTVSTGTLGGEQ